ncbi:MAG: methyltransferase [Alphaproteobacteria bacterium]|nr:methyltransferase [Alphaproteobacteria bacterium]
MDDATDVLLRPWRAAPPVFAEGDHVGFLGARAHPDLARLVGPRLRAVQPFAPWALTLTAAGHEVQQETGDLAGLAAVLVLPDRQVDAGLGRLAEGWLALRDGGQLVVCAPAREGGKRWPQALAELAGHEVEVDVKARCRVAWATREGSGGDELARRWLEAAAPRRDADGRWTRPGVFSWERVDAGTALLAASLPPTLAGRVADAGAGHGVLSDLLLARCPEVEGVHLLEADARALALAERTLAERHAGRVLGAHWGDATARWPVWGLDAVVTNPPLHVGGREDPELGRAVLRRAAEALRPGGVCWLVANRHLPYEAALREAFARVRPVTTEGGFKVLEAHVAA